MSFVPPVFKKLGVSCSDLLSKKYDLHNEAKIVTKTDGVTVEAAVNGSKAGSQLVKFAHKSFGEGELKLGTSGACNLKVKFNKFYKGFDTTVATDAAMNSNVELNFKQDSLACNAKITADKIAASLCFGTGGITFGASTALTMDGKLKDYNVGTQYGAGDVTLTLTTAKKLDDVTVSMFHKYSSAVQWGAQLNLADSNGLTIGTQYSYDDLTTVKAKYSTCGDLTCVFERKLSNAKLNLCSAFDASSGKQKKLGVGLVFGDY